MDLKLDMDDGFTSSSQSTGCPSRNSSFSDVSSAYNPFTPTSDCSTPMRRSNSANFDVSFPGPFDLTPPSSVASARFPYDFNKPIAHQELLFNGLPSTPTKYNVVMDTGLDFQHLNGQLTPPQTVDFSPFNAFGPGPFISPCHELGADGPEPMDDIWSQLAGDAPIDFSEVHHGLPTYGSSPMVHQPNQGPGSPYAPQMGHSRRQAHIAGAQQKAAALQSIQKSPRLKHRSRARRSRQSRPIPMCGPVKNIPLRQYYCDQGCTGKAYSRQEHLKRHFLTAHNPEKPVISCKFCPKDKVKIFDRADNYRQHLELHAKPGRKGRVEYHANAAKELVQLKAQIKRRAPPKSKTRDE